MSPTSFALSIALKSISGTRKSCDGATQSRSKNRTFGISFGCLGLISLMTMAGASMYEKVCPTCKCDFKSAYASDRWCSPTCRNGYTHLESNEKWLKGKPRGKVDPRNAFRLFGLDKPDDYGWG